MEVARSGHMGTWESWVGMPILPMLGLRHLRGIDAIKRQRFPIMIALHLDHSASSTSHTLIGDPLLNSFFFGFVLRATATY